MAVHLVTVFSPTSQKIICWLKILKQGSSVGVIIFQTPRYLLSDPFLKLFFPNFKLLKVIKKNQKRNE